MRVALGTSMLRVSVLVLVLAACTTPQAEVRLRDGRVHTGEPRLDTQRDELVVRERYRAVHIDFDEIREFRPRGRRHIVAAAVLFLTSVVVATIVGASSAIRCGEEDEFFDCGTVHGVIGGSVSGALAILSIALGVRGLVLREQDRPVEGRLAW